MPKQDLLARYRAKRDFTRTAEPEGRTAGERHSRGTRAKLRFAVQKHAASRLHFDLRLELSGVLKSWAVTRGPSLDPADKRLAVEVEDHPIDYRSFEGVIGAGYGTGTVMLWDEGTWEPAPEIADPAEALATDNPKFALHGERLRGGWDLVRMKPRPQLRGMPPEGCGQHLRFTRSLALPHQPAVLVEHVDRRFLVRHVERRVVRHGALPGWRGQTIRPSRIPAWLLLRRAAISACRATVRLAQPLPQAQNRLRPRRGSLCRAHMDCLKYKPRRIVTDGLRSYGVAQREVLPDVRHQSSRYLNNRAENSHRPTRRRERQMQRFKSPQQAQRFLSSHGMIYGHFLPRRHLMTTDQYRRIRDKAFRVGRQEPYVQMAVLRSTVERDIPQADGIRGWGARR